MENIDKEEIDEVSGDECFTTLDKSQYIIFYFTASWCGPCKRVYPDLLKIKKQLDPKNILLFKIDIDNDNDEICNKCDIKSVPSFLLFKDRTFIERVNGADSQKLVDMINKNCFKNNNKNDNN